jgi:hypothetical protein
MRRMAADEALADLARRLRGGTLDRVAPEELDAILGWVTGAKRRAGAELEALLGSSQADPALLWDVYQQLDQVLFWDGILREEAAGVSATVPSPERRARYRRLMTAFHPDRYPDRAEWFTPRSQAILQSYGEFRHETPGRKAAPTEAKKPAPRPPPRRRFLPRVHFGPGLLVTVRDSLRRVRYLEIKLLAIVATALFVPVLVIYLNQYPVPTGYDFPAHGAPDSEGGIAAIAEEASGPEEHSPNRENQQSAAPVPDPEGYELESQGEMTAPEPWEKALAALGQKSEGERAAARDAIARELAAQEIAAIEAAARQATKERREAREAAAREAVAREAATRQAAAREAAAREAAAREAAAREVAAREAAAREAAAREAAAREAAAREAAAREAAAREAAAREAAARDAAAREAAAREAAARETAALEAAAREAAAREAATVDVADSRAAPSSMTQLRVAALIDSYRIAFENGDIVAFMRHFGPDPRENTNRGRAWFEKNYKDLFAQSWQRKFALDIYAIAPTSGGDWKVSANYDLRIDYLTRPAVHVSGPVHYRVQNQPEGWRIDSIEYGN